MQQLEKASAQQQSTAQPKTNKNTKTRQITNTQNHILKTSKGCGSNEDWMDQKSQGGQTTPEETCQTGS